MGKLIKVKNWGILSGYPATLVWSGAHLLELFVQQNKIGRNCYSLKVVRHKEYQYLVPSLSIFVFLATYSH